MSQTIKSSSAMKKLLWVSIILSAVTFMCQPVADPDLWWHITVGRWIIAHKEIPQVDLWNMFAVNKPWVPYSWSNEVVLAWVDSNFGDYGLLAAKCLLILALVSSLCFCLSKVAGSWFIGTFFGLFASFGTLDHLTLRPQSFVWILFTYLIFTADRIKEDGFNWKRGLCCVLIGSAWANSHLSAFLGVLLTLSWTYTPKNKSLYQLTTLCFLLGTLITPHFGAEWLIFFNKASHPMEYNIIREFQPANILQFATVFLVLAVVLQGVFFHFQQKLLNPIVLIVSILFTLGSLAVVKFIPFAVILGTFILAKLWSKAGGEMRSFGNISESFLRLEALWNKIPVQGLTFVFLCIVIRNSFAVYSDPIHEMVVPVSAMDYILSLIHI